MKGQRIRIKLQGFDYRVIDQSAQDIVETAKRSGARVSGPIPLPTRSQIFKPDPTPNSNDADFYTYWREGPDDLDMDGIVDIAGWQNGYGNVVHVKHAGGRTTVYAHLSRVDVRKGQRVDQGQTVGAVGATGWATGPHLHYEFRVNGAFQNPLAMARKSESVPVSAESKPAFTRQASTVRLQLAAATQLQAGGAQ